MLNRITCASTHEKLITRVYHTREKVDNRPAVDNLSSDFFVSAAEMTIIGNTILVLPELSCNIVKIYRKRECSLDRGHFI